MKHLPWYGMREKATKVIDMASCLAVLLRCVLRALRPWLIATAVVVVALQAICARNADAADLCQQYRLPLKREAQAIYGLNAPIPALVGQLRQESSCRAEVTAWDNGRGLAQFMDGTAEHVSKVFPELGAPAPYNPTWAIRALVRYDDWLLNRVKGDNLCERWAAMLKGYNAGLGYVQRAQRQSPTPGKWFDATENINAGQSRQNFEHSRSYPHLILFKHQPLYKEWGSTLCLEEP